MSIKKRLNAAEKKAGIGSDIEIFKRITSYENKDGGIEYEYYRASIGKPDQAQSYFSLISTEGETSEEFDARVESKCLQAFGALPKDWAAERA